MGFEKEGLKSGGGGYVGGFFQLFDWKAKSRKKLFSSKSDLPARSKQGKISDGTLPMTRFNLMDEDEIAVGSSIRGSSDYSCASSVTDDDGCGGRAPGVVARLMGLDSMPTSSFSEPSSTPFFDTQSLRESFHQRKHFEYYHDPQIPYSGKLLNKEDGPSRNFLDPKPQKVLSRPIEKFQTEVLPPKSAKTIPITHHKLLSPIKSPGFIPSKTAAHIMEAAARIIEPSPQGTARAKISGVGSSSVPLKVRDLKERLEVAQKVPLVGSSSSTPLRNRELREKVDSSNRTSRLAESSRKPVESNAAKYLKGQSLNKSWNGSVDTPSFRALSETEESSSGLKKDKGKSISLAIQAKVNVQRRESLNSSSSRSLVSQKDQNEVMSTQTFKSQPNTQKSLPKKPSAHNPSSVLRQNNHKQNCTMDKDKSPKSSVSNLHSRKALASASSLSGNSSSVRQKTPGKIVGSKPGARKLVSEVKESDKKLPNHSTNHTPRKKRSIDGNLQIERNLVDNMLIDNNQKEPEPKPAMDRHFNWVEESKRKGVDVVSFTFTAPLTRSVPGYESGSGGHKNSGTCVDNRGKRLLLDTDSTKLSTVGYNMIGGDALSSLLEQKLKELTSSVEASSHNSVKPGLASSSLSFLQDLSPSFNGSSTSKFHDDKGQNMLLSDKLGSSRSNSDVFSTDRGAFRFSHLFQGIDEVEEYSSKSNDSRKQIDCRRPSPISVLEPSFSTESCSSFDSTDYSSSEGSKQSSSIQAQEILGLSSLKKFNYIDGDTDLSDSASSTSTSGATGRSANEWEIEYVQKMFCNLEFMFQNFAIGQSSEIMNPNLFNQLEIQKDRGFMNNNNSVEARLERKVLFDCVNECLDIRCRQYVDCGYKTWIKGLTMVGRKEFLAQEVLKEISAWRGMGDCMVDELVDKDMSNQHGRWLDFEMDAFSLGAEIEDQIYSSLLDEVVADIFCH